MKRFRLLPLLALLLLLALPTSALAQTYLFSLDDLNVNVFWNQDGTSNIDYIFTFTNNPSASPIDYVDVGTPNGNFDQNQVTADVNGQPLVDISTSGYQGSGTGVAVGLGGSAIRPGETGKVHVLIPNVRRVLRQDSSDSSYASAVFGNTFFGSKYVTGKTNLTVTFHLPPGVQPSEPRWHASPSGWAAEPATALDSQGRVTYSWNNPFASGSQEYIFGASFPAKYVPADAIFRPSLLETLGISAETLQTFACCGGAILFFALIVFWSARSASRRKLAYLPPKVAIEGHGIKRGLTAVEAAILMEEPMDKILTMILFGVVKKGAATVTTREPLQITAASPQPDGLQSYEQDFIIAFMEADRLKRRKLLQDLMVALVNEVANKMKGFSRRETLAYYNDIVKRAWTQVETAQTPDVKSQAFDQNMEWTMLDKQYDHRTQDVFRSGPVFVPVWWGRYDPGFGRTASVGGGTPSIPVSTGKGGGMSLPTLPGAAFAASVVNGVQNFSSSVVGNVSEFTSGVTNKTNPVPVSTSSGGSYHSSGGGHSCACACACAGCACACAGGGR